MAHILARSHRKRELPTSDDHGSIELLKLPFADFREVQVNLLGKFQLNFVRPNPQTPYTLMDQQTMIHVRRDDNYLQILNVPVPFEAYEVHFQEANGATTVLSATERVHMPVTLTDGSTCPMQILIVADPLGRKVSVLGTDNDRIHLKVE